MRSCLLSVIGFCVLLWTAAGAAGQQPQKKPEVGPGDLLGGRTLAQWIGDISSKDRSKAENALRTIPLYGPEHSLKAVPAILAELKKHGPTHHLDTSTRATAAIALGKILGPAEKPDARLVDEAVVALKRLLGDGQSFVKFRAAEALGELGPRAKAATADLLSAAEDKDTWEVRQAAVVALRAISVPGKDGPDPIIVKALCGAVRDDAAPVRLAGAQGLLWFGPPASAAGKQEMLAALNAAAQDPEPPIQMMGQVALVRLKAKGWENHLRALGKFLKNDDPLLRMQAAEAVGTIGADAQSQVPRLIEMLKDGDQRVISWSIWALERLGRAAAEAVPHLQQFAGDADRPANLRKMAAEAVDTIQGKKAKTP